VRILEREAHVAHLTARLGEARRGSGRLVLVAGEAGIGKTALVDAFLASLPRGTQVLRGGCDPVVPARPFAPISDIATDQDDGLREALASADRDRVFDRFLALLRRTGTGGVVVLEDLHWADSATLDLLKVVGRRLPDLPTLVIGTYRPHEVDGAHPLRLALGDMPPGLVDDLPVPPLSVAAVESLARDAGRDATDLHRATGGNAFFVTEVLASRGGAAPSSVIDAVGARVSRLSGDAQRALRATAVLGARVEPQLVSAVVDDASAAGGLRECLARGMLEEREGFLTFRHELARQAVLDALPADDRVRLHQRALAVLRSGVVPADAVRLIQHAIEAGHSEAIGELAPRAAELAGGLGAHGEAADYLAVALALAGLVDERRRADLLEQYAYECSMSDRVAAARSAQDAALVIWRRLGDARREGNGYRALAMFMWLGGEGDRAREVAESAVATLEPIEPHGRELAEAYAKVAQILTNSGQDDAAARRWATRAIELAERLGEEQILVHALTTLGLAHIYNEGDAMFATGWAHLEEAHRRAKTGGLYEDLIRILINFVETARDLGRYDDAERYADEATAVLREREFELYRHLLNVRIAQLALTRGRWEEAERGAKALLSGSSHSNQVRVRALETLGRLRARRGEPGAWVVLDQAMAVVGRGELQDICPLHAARAEVAWLDGDLDRAGAEAVAGMEFAAPTTSSPALYGELSFLAWRAGRIDRLPDGAGEAYVLHTTGRFREAAVAWRSLGCPYDEALALADSDDQHDLRDALAILHDLGASVMAKRVAERLVSLGARSVPRGPRPSTRANPAGLSAREMEILGLIRQGARNAEIAERLVLSPKTVDHHVSAILRKLGVRDRAAARRKADRLALEDGERPAPI
jgi:DNA-binding CsgD family transcriptional regulator/tetratricopeptide (TPR) repeat protein